MNTLILGGLGAALTILAIRSKNTPQAQAKNPSAPRGVQLSQRSKNPGSAQAPRADQGNSANQPWYQGAAVAVGGLAIAEIAKNAGNIVSYFKSDNNSEDTTITPDSVDIAQELSGLDGESGILVDQSSSIDPAIDVSTIDSSDTSSMGDIYA